MNLPVDTARATISSISTLTKLTCHRTTWGQCSFLIKQCLELIIHSLSYNTNLVNFGSPLVYIATVNHNLVSAV